MRVLRLLFALLVAASLASLPIAATMASAQAGEPHASMSASDTDCPCCRSTQQHAGQLKCCGLQALLVEGWAVPKPSAGRFAEGAQERGVDQLPQPDPPPPRG
jgi:hypothetical protein